MESIAVSEFKARCLAILEQVRRTGRPVLVTKRGEPLAEIVAPSRLSPEQRWLGSAAHSGRILGDLVAPAVDPKEWEALR